MKAVYTHYPVDHPEFRYRPSANPYWKRLHEQDKGVYLDARAEVHAGKWRTFFLDSPETTTPRDLVVEVGCNGGHWILEQAKHHPHQNFIGMDWKFKQVYRAYEKAIQKNLKNILFIRGYAQRLEYLFGKEEISSLHLLFPDPWPKKSQQKNRFLTTRWFTCLAQRTRLDGTLELKSDHPEYFDWITQQIKNSGCWQLETFTRNLHPDTATASLLPLGEVTLFEQLFIKKGLPIQRAHWKRISF